MKNLIIIFLVILGAGILSSCEKELKDPKLDINLTVLPDITSPAEGAAFILLKDDADNVMTNFEWTPTQYNLENLESTKYVLQMDKAGNNFVDPHDLVSTEGTSFSMTVGAMNTILLNMELNPDEASGIELRVRSFVNEITTYSEVFSDKASITITPFSDNVIISPIYLIGDATPAGWDNALGSPMEHIGGGKFARVETLNATGDWFKFIATPGAWVPQWGTDASGTSESGPLVYRPDDPTPDPSSIPSYHVEGDYYFMADTFNLLYETYLTSGELYLVGDATPAGWDAAVAIAFTESSPHVFTIATSLNAGGGMKFLEVKGAWAPQWGTNTEGTNKEGLLSYRPTESVPDPPQIPGPSAAGNYLITVDMTTMKYTIEAQ